MRQNAELVALGLALLGVLLAPEPLWAQSGSPSSEAPAAARADRKAVQAIRRHAWPISGSVKDYDRLLSRLAGKRFVLLGEDTHGTQEIYLERTRITRRLVTELDFDAVVIESDYTPVARTNRFLLGEGGDPDAASALGEHQRFPIWMWVNAPFRDLIDWLRHYNRATGRRVQVFGMDLHGMSAAVTAIRESMDTLAPHALEPLEAQLACLAAFEFQPDRYRAAISSNVEGSSCEAATSQAVLLVENELTALPRPEAQSTSVFDLRRNLALLAASEAYARVQVKSGVDAWNLRDRHMAATADAIAEHLETRLGRPARLALWAHNTHMSDARSTDRGRHGAYLSLGQIMRENHGDETYILGFSTRLGTVRAAANWGERDRVFSLRRPAWESVSALFGRTRLLAFCLALDAADPGLAPLEQNIPMRAIGVVYWPHAERSEHYFRGDLRGMFDGLIHLDRTRALTPLDGNRRLPDRGN